MPKPNRKFDILIIEDNAADVQLLQLFFSECAPSVTLHFAQDGMEGHDLLFRKGKYEAGSTIPDIILMDLNMPRKDGRTLIRELKSSDLLAHIPIIMLSTSSSDREVSECYRLGASAFITKPVDINQFQQLVKTLVTFFFECVTLSTKSMVKP